MAERRDSKVPPLCLALILCEAVYRDGMSGKRTLFGMFSALLAREFPAKHPMMAVHCALTDGHGSTSVMLRIEGPDGVESVSEAQGVVQFTDPRDVIEMDFVLGNIVFPTPGEYRIQLYGAGDLLLERRLMVAQIPGGSENVEDDH